MKIKILALALVILAIALALIGAFLIYGGKTDCGTIIKMKNQSLVDSLFGGPQFYCFSEMFKICHSAQLNLAEKDAAGQEKPMAVYTVFGKDELSGYCRVLIEITEEDYKSKTTCPLTYEEFMSYIGAPGGGVPINRCELSFEDSKKICNGFGEDSNCEPKPGVGIALCSNPEYSTKIGLYGITLDSASKKRLENEIEKTGDSALQEITDLQCLEYLYLENVSDFEHLAGLKKLKKLGLSYKDLNDLAPLSAMENLEELYIGDSSVSDISPITNLTKLKRLDLSSRELSDASVLGGLKSLESLSLASAKITDFSFLSNLTNLSVLHLSNTSISDVHPLERLINLTGLKLRNTKISDTTALKKLTNLEYLDLAQTNVSAQDCASLEIALPNTEVTC